ncbi:MULTISPECIES: hypothetical protein [Bacillus]|uniref:hypothetical protein n=1 Tax=Bacillus TaxID=1386 RepID=UPI0007065340|nr:MULTISPECIES: hypothetical protein [Bacillus]ALM27074.1 hypothetical protein AKO65_03135 [Bacillus altitudinis]ALM47163.1 hypothetical protein AMR71_18710 [Bacillus altitudinis]ANY98645.1 hypothetical protein AKO66_18715 [Bacillus altitudinis]MDJ0288349.1 hypothetical protein [Bacillus altitudinis]
MESIVKLFNNNNIKYIVSVDDCYMEEDLNEVDEVILLEKIKENLMDYKEKISEIDSKIDISQVYSFPEHIREEYIEKWFLKLTEREKSTLFDKNSFKNTILTSQKDNLLRFLKELHTKKAVEEYKTFGTIQEAKEFLKNGIKNIWDPSEERKVLWLIDREFGNQGNEGFDLLEEFCSSEYQWNIGILATQNTNDIEGEVQFNSYLETSNERLSENKNLIWLIEKDLIDSERSIEFVETISHGLRRNYTFKITNFLTDTISSGIKGASATFKNIEQSTINKIILKFSTQEGASIIDTLTRILMAITKYDMNNQIYENIDNITKVVDSYDKLCKDIDVSSITNFDEVIKFRNREKYNTFVNRHYYPIGFGDIFCIDNQEYLLISQACDIQIRGDQGGRNLQKGTLLRITNEKPDTAAHSKLEYYKHTETYYILHKEAISIDFNILDLCSLNNEGKALVELKQLDSGLLNNSHRYLIGQRKRLEEVLNDLKKMYKQYTDITSSFEDIRNYILNIDSEKKDEIKSILEDYHLKSNQYRNSFGSFPRLEINSNEIFYPVKRICRLDELYTTNIMMEYSAYSSRLALPGDYALPFRHTKYKVLYKNPNVYLNGDNDLIDVSTHITVARSEDIKQIYEKVIADLIVGEVSKEIEEKIRNNPKSYICIDNSEKTIILPADLLICEGAEAISFITESIKIKKDEIEHAVPIFSELLYKMRKNKDFIKNNKLFNFYNNEEINEIINFKLDKFRDGHLSISIEDKTILDINFNLEEKEDKKFKFSYTLDPIQSHIEII